MAKYTQTFTTNTSVKICDINRRRSADFYVATILAYGTFGGGTVAFTVSPDNGTTKIPLTSNPGDTAISLTVAGMVLVNFGNPHSNSDVLQLWATLTGATSPALIVSCYDNK